jgi:hypothetical protein
MTTAFANAIRVLQERATVDPDLAEAVVYMAEEVAGPDNPFADVPSGALQEAGLVNERRLRARRSAASSACLDTAEVVALLRSVNDRKGVDRRRQRGQLLGWRAGARVLHPGWQFDRRRGETKPGLPRVLAALRGVTADAEAADQLMTTPRDDLGGASLADLLASGHVETVVRLISASSEQS